MPDLCFECMFNHGCLEPLCGHCGARALDSDVDKSIDKINLKRKVPGMTDVFTTRGEAEDRAEELGNANDEVEKNSH